MALNASNLPFSSNRKKPEDLEPGGYAGRVVQVIDLGLQPRSYQGAAVNPQPELWVTYELGDEFLKNEDGDDLKDKPRWFSHRFPVYNLKNSKANSTAFYNAIDPQGVAKGNWAELIGYPVNIMLTLEKDKKGELRNYVGGLGVLKSKDAAKLPELVNAPKVFDLDNPDMEVFKSLPQFLQDAIKGNLNYNGSPLQKLLGEKAAPQEEAKTEVQLEDENPF